MEKITWSVEVGGGELACTEVAGVVAASSEDATGLSTSDSADESPDESSCSAFFWASLSALSLSRLSWAFCLQIGLISSLVFDPYLFLGGVLFLGAILFLEGVIVLNLRENFFSAIRQVLETVCGTVGDEKIVG